MFRVLGTPTNSQWEGVEQLPDYKTAFPKWKPKNLKDVLPDMEPAGIDLLQVSFCSFKIYLVLIDDIAFRFFAKHYGIAWGL